MENADGLILEVIEWNAMTRPYFKGIEKRVREADPEQLVHEFAIADLTPKLAVFGMLIRFMVRRAFGRIEKTRRAA